MLLTIPAISCVTLGSRSEEIGENGSSQVLSLTEGEVACNTEDQGMEDRSCNEQASMTTLNFGYNVHVPCAAGA